MIPNKNKSLSSCVNPESVLALCLLAGFAVTYWHFTTESDSLRVAWTGWSPFGWAYRFNHPELFRRNFDSGDHNYIHSLLLAIYPVLSSWTNIQPEVIYQAHRLLEALLYFSAVYFLSKAILPSNLPWRALCTALILYSGTTTYLSLASFGGPVPYGLTYDFADAFRFIALGLVLRHRTTVAFIAIACSYLCHPIMGLLGLISVTVCALLPAEHRAEKRTLVEGFIFFVLAIAPWCALNFSSSTEVQVPEELFFRFTPAFNSHWYPIDRGLFTTQISTVLIPFCALSIFAFTTLCLLPVEHRQRRALQTLFLVLLFITFCGLVNSNLKLSLFWTKLALHRAGDLLLVLQLIIVVGFLLSITESFDKVKTLLVGGILTTLLSPFTIQLLPILLTSLTSVLLLQESSNQHERKVLRAATTMLLLLTIWSSVSGLENTFAAIPREAALIFLLCLAGVVVRSIAANRLGQISILLSIMLSCPLSRQVGERYSQPKVPAADFRTAQLWARDNTPRESLFFVDPTIYYGWRDFSRRSSFGNLREWLHTSWLYNSNLSTYQEGMRRFEEFGIAIEPFLNEVEDLKGFNRLTATVQRKFYTSSDDWKIEISQKYGIDYFVQRADIPQSKSNFHVVYQNQHFRILRMQR